MTWIKKDWRETQKATLRKQIAENKPHYRDHPCRKAVKEALVKNAQRTLRRLR